MRHRVIPTLAPATKSQAIGDGCYETKSRGLAVLNSPILNEGTAFSAVERKELGLTGLPPPEIGTLRTQVWRAYIQYERLPDALSKNTFLTSLQDRNEVPRGELWKLIAVAQYSAKPCRTKGIVDAPK